MGPRKRSDHALSENVVPLGAEDRFAVIGIRDAPRLAPSSDDGLQLGSALKIARAVFPGTIPVFDVRGLDQWYHDVEYFVSSVVDPLGVPAHLLVEKADLQHLDVELLAERGHQILQVRHPNFNLEAFDLSLIRRADESDDYVDAYEIVGDLFHGILAGMSAPDRKKYEIPDSAAGPLAGEIDLGAFERDHYAQVAQAISNLTIDRARELVGTDLASGFLAVAPLLAKSLRDADDRWDMYHEVGAHISAAELVKFISNTHRHSLLIEFCMQAKRS